jgi:ribosomal protein S18 acetylase RimI-like enzyme
MLKIRPILPRDKATVMTILRATPEFLPHEVTIAEELIDSFLNKGKLSGYTIEVAEIDGKVVGYICWGDTPLTDGTWDIYWVAVDRNEQGKGIGAQLMAAAEKSIYATGGRLAVVETSGKPDYNKTRQFYLKIGYVEEARIKDFYTAGDDKVIMVKRLG